MTKFIEINNNLINIDFIAYVTIDKGQTLDGNAKDFVTFYTKNGKCEYTDNLEKFTLFKTLVEWL